MKNTIKHILKEDRKERYYQMVVGNFTNDTSVQRINTEFESVEELLAMGWEDEFYEFAYNEFETYGFIYDEENDSYSHEGRDYVWGEVRMNMDRYFIEKGVKDGIFNENDYGWEIVVNDFEVINRYGNFILEYQCVWKNYVRVYSLHEIDRILETTFGLMYPSEREMVSEMIYKKFVEILEPHKKVC